MAAKRKSKNLRSRRGLNTPSKLVVSLFVFTATITTTAFEFISIELALLAFGILR